MATAYAVGGNQFEKSLRRFAKKAEQYGNAVTHRVVIDLAATIIQRSPWGRPELWHPPRTLAQVAPYEPGAFRANWQYGEGVMPGGTLKLLDVEGKDTQRRIAASVPTQAGDLSHFIVNRLPYGPRLEFEGWSSQAPAGMVGITVLEFDAIVKRAVADVKGANNGDQS